MLASAFALSSIVLVVAPASTAEEAPASTADEAPASPPAEIVDPPVEGEEGVEPPAPTEDAVEPPEVAEEHVESPESGEVTESPLTTADGPEFIKTCRFGKAQIFDVQWYISDGFLNISGVTYPYGYSRSPNQLSDSTLLDTDYFMFVESTSNPGKLTLEQFAENGTSKGLLNAYMDPQSLGEGFIFVLGEGFYGTVLTTAEALHYNTSRTLAVTPGSPTVDDLRAYTTCSSTIPELLPLPTRITSDAPGDGRTGLDYSEYLDVEATGTVTFTITSGSLPPGLAIELEEAWGLNRAAASLTGTPTAVGSYTFTVTADNGTSSDSQTYTVEITEGPQPVVITSGNPGRPVVGEEYSFPVTATADPEGYLEFYVSDGDLPDGLTLDWQTGIISGVPTTPGPVTLTIRAMDWNFGLFDEREYVIDVATDPIAVSIDAGAPIETAVTQEVSHGFTAGGTGTIVFSIVSGALPDGLSLKSATGLVTGTATVAGEYTLRVKASNGSTHDEADVVVIVHPATAIDSDALAEAQVGEQYTVVVKATGGPEKTFRVSAGALPAGLTLDALTGIISGIPGEPGSHEFTVEVSDGFTTASQPFTVTVIPAAPSFVDLAYTGVTSGPGVLISAGSIQVLSGLSLVWMAIAYRRRLLAPNRAMIRWLLLHPTPRW